MFHQLLMPVKKGVLNTLSNEKEDIELFDVNSAFGTYFVVAVCR